MKTVWILISWLLQKSADLDLHCLQESSQRVSYFERVKVQKRCMYKLIYSFGQVNIFFGQEHYGHLLVPGQVENLTISTPLPRLISELHYKQITSIKTVSALFPVSTSFFNFSISASFNTSLTSSST